MPPRSTFCVAGGVLRQHRVATFTSARLGFATLNYSEIPFGPDRPVRLKRQRDVDQIANGPDPVSNAQRHGWRGPQRLMDAAEIVMGNVQADRSRMIGELL